MGGAERVAAAMHDSFPTAPIYTTVALPHRLPKELRGADIRTSAMQHLPGMEQRFRQYFMLYPFAVEHFDLSEFDLIFSSSSGYAKGVRRRSNAIHVCYCHTPMRWVWRYEDYVARENFGRVTRSLLPLSLWGLKKVGPARGATAKLLHRQFTAGGATHQSKSTAAKRLLFRRQSMSIDFTCLSQVDDYYLVLSRLVPYKRIDLAIEACNRLNRRLVIIGDGPDRARLEKLAGPKTEFLGRQPDSAGEPLCQSLSRAPVYW